MFLIYFMILMSVKELTVRTAYGFDSEIQQKIPIIILSEDKSQVNDLSVFKYNYIVKQYK